MDTGRPGSSHAEKACAICRRIAMGEGRYGTKIKRAVELREEGHLIAIISEKHWQASMLNLV